MWGRRVGELIVMLRMARLLVTCGICAVMMLWEDQHMGRL